MVFVFVGAHEVAESVEVDLRALVELSLGEKMVHHSLRLLKVLDGLDRGEGERQHMLQIEESRIAPFRLNFVLTKRLSGKPCGGTFSTCRR